MKLNAELARIKPCEMSWTTPYQLLSSQETYVVSSAMLNQASDMDRGSFQIWHKI